MREYLIEDLGGLMVHYRATHDHQLADILDGAIAHIISIEAELKAREWISVEDELPTKTGDVYSVVSGGETNFAFWHSRSRKFLYEPMGMAMTVTHWMPLPSPPESDNG